MIWLTGRAGLLGREVERVLRARRVPYVASGREVDVADRDVVSRFAAAIDPPLLWVLNCAAFTAVAAAEADNSAAYAVNRDGPDNLAAACSDNDAALLHISSDYVFDGSSEQPRDEEAATRPINVYGASKLAGEQAVRSRLPCAHLILRTSWLYGAGGGNFVATMLKLMAERDQLAVVDDQWGSPTPAGELACAIITLVERHRRPAHHGTFHYSGRGRTSWFGFAQEIYRLGSREGLVRPGLTIRGVSSADYPSRVARPRNSYLATTKIQAAYGLRIRPWQESLGDFISTHAQRTRVEDGAITG